MRDVSQSIQRFEESHGSERVDKGVLGICREKNGEFDVVIGTVDIPSFGREHPTDSSSLDYTGPGRHPRWRLFPAEKQRKLASAARHPSIERTGFGIASRPTSRVFGRAKRQGLCHRLHLLRHGTDDAV